MYIFFPFVAGKHTAQQLGFELVYMYYMDGQVVTVGTERGNAYLISHPAILSKFQAEILSYIDSNLKSIHNINFIVLYVLLVAYNINRKVC